MHIAADTSLEFSGACLEPLAKIFPPLPVPPLPYVGTYQLLSFLDLDPILRIHTCTVLLHFPGRVTLFCPDDMEQERLEEEKW